MPLITALTDPSALLDAPVFRPEMAFPYLTDGMIECIRGYASEVVQPGGTSIFTRGQHGVDLFVVLEGTINIYASDENGDIESVRDLGPHQFSGELNMLNDQVTLVGGRTTVNSVLLRVTRDNLRLLMRAEGEIANLIMQALIWRRIGLMWQSRVGVILYGHVGDADTLKLQRFLTRNGYPHRLLPAPDRESRLAGTHVSAEQDSWPAIGFNDGRLLHRPTIAMLADVLGITELPDASTIYDVAVVGAGPAGLAASVYSASEGLSTIAIESIAPGGQAGTSSNIENYLGFPTGISGQRLAQRAWMQSLKFGVRFAISREAASIEPHSDVHKITLEGGVSFCSRAVVIATGAQYRKLPLDNFDQFENQGIYYAATAMETSFCRNKEVVVVGGGNSAGQATLYLSQIASHVYLMIRGKSLAETMSQYLLSRIENSPRISILTETEIESLEGRSHLEQVIWVNRCDGSRTSKRVENLFVMIGAQPNTSWLRSAVKLDEKGFVQTGGSGAFDGTPYATNVSGIYAVGDVRAVSVKRVASAVGEGSVVISDVYRYLAFHHDVYKSA
jgi:thioredoxin reductase (NADPH)